MESGDSCEKLIGIEAGLPWPEQAKDLPIVVALRREKTVTRCMSLLYAFLTIIVLLLVFLYFWSPVTKPTGTQVMFENLEIEKAELLVPMDSNDVASGTGKVTVDDTKTKISSPYPSVPLREEGMEDWTEDDIYRILQSVWNDDVTKVITTPAEETSDASHEDNNLPQKWESPSDSNESTRNSLPSSDESSEAKDNETSEKLDAYDERNSEVSNSGVAETTTEPDSYSDGLSVFPTTSEDSLRGQGSSDEEEKKSEIITEKVIEIEKENSEEETQKSENYEEKTDYGLIDPEYESYYNDYDEDSLEENYEYSESPSKELPPSVEESEEAPIMNELDVKVPTISSSTPTTIGSTIDESDELPSPLNDRESLHDNSAEQLPESDSILETVQDTNEPDEAEKIVDESSMQNYDPLTVDGWIFDPCPLESIIYDSNDNDYGNHGSFSDKDNSGYSDRKQDLDWGLRMKFKDPQQEDSDYWWLMNMFNDKLFFGKATDEQNKDKTTEDETIREAETTMQPVSAEEMVTIENPSLSNSKIDSSPQSSTEFIPEDNTGKDDTLSTSQTEKYASEDAPSEESVTVESRSIPNDTEDSQQVNEDTVNLEPTSESVEDSESFIMDSMNSALLPYYCDVLKDLFSEDVDLESNISSEYPEEGEMKDELDKHFRELWLNRCFLSRGKHLDGYWGHLIYRRSLTERASDSPSVSKAGQILTAMQQVIKQDRNYIHDAVSRIHGSMTPVVESQVNEFFEKMEAVSSHIDRLHEQYLKKNKLEDDYVSREFPSEP